MTGRLGKVAGPEHKETLHSPNALRLTSTCLNICSQENSTVCKFAEVTLNSIQFKDTCLGLLLGLEIGDSKCLIVK